MKKENVTRGMIMIILSAFCFACMNMCVRLAGDVPSIQKSFFRNLVAALFAGSVLWRNHISLKMDRSCWVPMAFRAICGTIGILCNFYAVDHLLVADASILNKLSPFFAIIFSILLLKEKLKPMQAICVALAFLGCIFIVKPGFHNASFSAAMVGVCGGLGAGVAYTMVRIMGNRGVKGPIIVFYFSVFSCLAVVPWCAMHFAPMTAQQLGILLLAGLFAAGGQFGITAAYTYAPARKVSIYDYSQVIFATILGFLLFGEIPDAYSFLGYALIIAASFVMFLYNRRGDV